MFAEITTKHGQLVAEYGGFEVYLAEFGIEGFGFGDTVELPYEPYDMYELVDMLV